MHILRTERAIEQFMANRCGSRNVAADTERWYRGILHHFASLCIILPRRPEEIDHYLGGLTCGDERKAGYYRALHALYHFLRRRDMIESNPMDMVDMPRRRNKLPRPLTADQLDQLLRYPHPAKVKACLMFLADTGCRISELHSIGQGSFTETPRGWVATISGKTGERYVPLSNSTYHAISPALPLSWTKYRLRIKVKQAFEAAHVPGSARSLRHTFGTLWDGEELALQSIMGHTNLETTRRYRLLKTAHLSEQHNQHSPLRLIFARNLSMI